VYNKRFGASGGVFFKAVLHGGFGNARLLHSAIGFLCASLIVANFHLPLSEQIEYERTVSHETKGAACLALSGKSSFTPIPLHLQFSNNLRHFSNNLRQAPTASMVQWRLLFNGLDIIKHQTK
jgi:hypothetical protein